MPLGETASAVSPYFLLLLAYEGLSVIAGGAAGLKTKSSPRRLDSFIGI
jgi:hypothetical protein